MHWLTHRRRPSAPTTRSRARLPRNHHTTGGLLREAARRRSRRDARGGASVCTVLDVPLGPASAPGIRPKWDMGIVSGPSPAEPARRRAGRGRCMPVAPCPCGTGREHNGGDPGRHAGPWGPFSACRVRSPPLCSVWLPLTSCPSTEGGCRRCCAQGRRSRATRGAAASLLGVSSPICAVVHGIRAEAASEPKTQPCRSRGRAAAAPAAESAAAGPRVHVPGPRAPRALARSVHSWRGGGTARRRGSRHGEEGGFPERGCRPLQGRARVQPLRPWVARPSTK